MLFNSWQFAIFFPIVAIIYFLSPYRSRWALLLIASYFFYMCAVPWHALLLFASTLIQYLVCLVMANATSPKAKLRYLALGISANLGMLFVFKYFNFFMSTVTDVGCILGFQLNTLHSQLMLPVGISFYVFQTLSYSIDVYRGHIPPERHLGRFALFVAFFPQLVAGPIERSESLLSQFKKNFDFDYTRVTGGLKLMAWGLFKKMVIADHLATCVDAVYNAPEELQGVHFVIATVLFAFQIYCDFSGYTDVAIGAAQVFGYKLMLNFDRPYQSRSIAEFWSRWHISLSTWFRDYLYIPLGGNRVAVPRWYLNLAIVFLVSGLWHGTSWTFVTWGALHAFFMIAAAATCSWRTKLSNELGIHKFPRFQAVYQQAAVFAMVCFSWIFFRANSFADAIQVVVGMGSGWSNLLEPSWFKSTWSSIGISQGSLAGAVALIGVLELVQAYNSNSANTVKWSQMFSQYHWSIRWVAYTCLMLAIVNLGAPRATPFIYFQF